MTLYVKVLEKFLRNTFRKQKRFFFSLLLQYCPTLCLYWPLLLGFVMTYSKNRKNGEKDS